MPQSNATPEPPEASPVHRRATHEDIIQEHLGLDDEQYSDAMIGGDIRHPITTYTGASVLTENSIRVVTGGLHLDGQVIIENGIINPDYFSFRVFARSATVSEDGNSILLDSGSGTITVDTNSAMGGRYVQVERIEQNIECTASGSSTVELIPLPVFRVSGRIDPRNSPWITDWETPTYNGIPADYRVGEEAWNIWNATYEPTPAPLLNLFGPETPEQRERREEAERVREQAKRHQAEINARAESLLADVLTKRQWKSWQQHGFFYERVGKNRYKIKRGRIGNVYLVDNKGNHLEQYCCHPVQRVPDADCVLAQMLMLRHSEKDFLEMANLHWRRKGFPGHKQCARMDRYHEQGYYPRGLAA